MYKLSYSFNGFTFKRITKTQARKLYNVGLNVIFCPCNLHPLNSWGLSMDINKINIDCNNRSFNDIVNDYTFLNCTNETGKYINFYIPVNAENNYNKKYMKI